MPTNAQNVAGNHVSFGSLFLLTFELLMTSFKVHESVDIKYRLIPYPLVLMRTAVHLKNSFVKRKHLLIEGLETYYYLCIGIEAL